MANLTFVPLTGFPHLQLLDDLTQHIIRFQSPLWCNDLAEWHFRDKTLKCNIPTEMPYKIADVRHITVHIVEIEGSGIGHVLSSHIGPLDYLKLMKLHRCHRKFRHGFGHGQRKTKLLMRQSHNQMDPNRYAYRSQTIYRIHGIRGCMPPMYTPKHIVIPRLHSQFHHDEASFLIRRKTVHPDIINAIRASGYHQSAYILHGQSLIKQPTRQ